MKKDAVLKSTLNNIEDQMRKNNLEGFKSAMKGVVKNLIKATEDIQRNWKCGRNREKIRKKIEFLHNELNQLKRFCGWEI